MTGDWTLIYLLLAQTLASGDASTLVSYLEHQLTPEAIATDFKNYTESIARLDERCEQNEMSLAALELTNREVVSTIGNLTSTLDSLAAELRQGMDEVIKLAVESVDSVDNRTTAIEVDVQSLNTQVKAILEDRKTAQAKVGDAPQENQARNINALNIVKVEGLLASGSSCTTRDVGGLPTAEACLKKCDESGESGCRFAMWNKLSTVCCIVSPEGNKCSFSNHDDYTTIYRSKAMIEYNGGGDYRGGDIYRDNALVAEKVTQLQCRYACDLIPECNVVGWWHSKKRCNAKTKNWNTDSKTFDPDSDFVSWKVNE